MRIDGFKLHGAASLAVLAAGVATAIVGSGSAGVTLAGPEVLRLIQQSSVRLSAYPAVTIDGYVRGSGNGQSVIEKLSGNSTADGRTGTVDVAIPGQPLSFRFVDGTLYAPIPAAGLSAFGGHHWLSCTSTSMAARDATPSDPYSFLRLMPAITGTVRALGHQTLRGVRTSHYRAELDLQRVAQLAQSQGQGDMTQDELRQLESLGRTTAPIDVWLDAQQVLRRFEMHFSVNGFTVTEQINVNGSTTVPHIANPPAADTMDESPCSFMVKQLLSYSHG